MQLGHDISSKAIVPPAKIFGDQRRNSKGWDITDPVTVAEIDAGRNRYKSHQWQGSPVLAVESTSDEVVEVRNPADPDDLVGQIPKPSEPNIHAPMAAARAGSSRGPAGPAGKRAEWTANAADWT